MKKISQKLMSLLIAVSIIVPISATAASTVMAGDDSGFESGVMVTVPAFAARHYTEISDKVAVVAQDLVPTSELKLAVDDRDRVLLMQAFDGDKAAFMNEAEGKAFLLEDSALLTNWNNAGAPKGVILAPVITDGTDKYLVTDTHILKYDGTDVTEYTYKVGELVTEGEGAYSGRVEATRLTDRFADAYRFAYNFNSEYVLGLPKGKVTSNTYNIPKLNTKGEYVGTDNTKLTKDNLVTGKVTEEKTYYQQEFDGGYIIQARLDQSPHYAAAPISREVYDIVTAIDGNQTLSITGAPVSRAYIVGDKTIQNFEYGLITIENDKATFEVDMSAAPNGTKMSRRIGAVEDNWDKAYNTANLFIEREQLRISEQSRKAVGAFIDEGGTPYYNSSNIQEQHAGHPMHEFAGRGVIQKMNSPDASTGVGGASFFLIAGHWYDGVNIVNTGDFSQHNVYFANGENKLDGLGWPTSNAKYYKNVKYQSFTWGIIYQVHNTLECIKQADFVTWMGESTTIEEALTANNVAVDPSEGSYKTVSFSLVGDKMYEISVENGARKFDMPKTMTEAFMGTAESLEQAMETYGIPVFMDDTILITTKSIYELNTTTNNFDKKNGLGALALASTDKVFGFGADRTNAVDYTSSVAAIITDSFADAYLFAYTRGGHDLGKPVESAKVQSFTDAGGVVYHYISQKFEHGVIVQNTYNDAAIAVYGNVLEAIEAKGGYSEFGVPIARQYTYEDVTYCNFSFGYLVIDADGAEFVYDKSVGFKGNEIDKNIGRMENRDNMAKAGADFEHEVLRVYEAYVTEYERVTDTGFRLFTGAVKQGHEWNGIGLTQSYTAGGSTSTAWGQQRFTVMLMNSPYEKAYIVRNSILDKYAELGGNSGANNFGMPTSDEFKHTISATDEDGNTVELEVTFQTFQKGTIYSFVHDDAIVAMSSKDIYMRTDGIARDADGNEVTFGITIEKPTDPWGDDGDDEDNKPPVIEDDGRLDPLTIIFIVLGSIVGAGAIGVGVFFLVKKYKKN